METQEIIEKLKDILSAEHEGRRVFDKDVAAALGMSKESLSHLKKKNGVPYEQVSKFCAARKISINWVLFGQLPKSLEEETEKYTRIKHFSKINASAGGGGVSEDEAFEYLSIDKKLLDSLYKSNNANPDAIIALNVVGDSMEPTLLDRELILCDTDNTTLSKGGIFVVSTHAGLFVKRVAMRVDGSLELLSDNKIYNSEILDNDALQSVRLIGKVMGKVGLV